MAFNNEDWEFVEQLYLTPVGRPKDLDDYIIIERVYPELVSKDADEFCILSKKSAKCEEAKMERKKPTRAARAAFIADSFSNFLKWQNCRQ
eukprot:symbB.v1.2.028112.t1/scaffold2945.1/size66705/3